VPCPPSPTITSVGMAALLPGASSSFSVVSHKDKLAVKIENIHMKDYQERSKFLKARIPKVYEVQLGKLLQATSSKLKKQIESASLVLVRSQEIDALGEGGEDWLARQLMDSVIGNIARAIKNQLNKSQVKAISDIKNTSPEAFQHIVNQAKTDKFDNHDIDKNIPKSSGIVPLKEINTLSTMFWSSRISYTISNFMSCLQLSKVSPEFQNVNIRLKKI
jgi:hypothetical protein